jgi:hypothetical protein
MLLLMALENMMTGSGGEAEIGRGGGGGGWGAKMSGQ